MTAEQYPKRPKFFANRLIRLLQKSCAANDIGIEACWLITCIALVEDAAHYSKPVTFWTGQLLPITGFHSWGRLDRARERAVAAGWLHYRQGTSRQCGSYWTMIPEAVQRAFSDSPVDEVNHQNGDDDTEVNHQNGDEVGDSDVMIRRFKRDDPVNLPSLFPDPVPKREGARKNTFRKPTIEEVSEYAKAYCTENDCPAIAPEDFVDHFESNGWRVGGKSPMKDWQASLRKWIRREQPVRGKEGSSKAKHAWNFILSEAPRHFGNQRTFETAIGDRPTSVLKQLGITRKDIEAADDYGRAQLRKRFVEAYDRTEVTA